MKHVFVCCLLIAVMHHSFAQNRETEIQNYFTALYAANQFNGGVLVAEKGKIIYQQSLGYADFEKKAAINRATIFPIASITKTITATAVLQLVEAGKLDIDKPVQTYLPNFPYKNILLRHLLSHTSGLPPYNAYTDSLRKLDPARVFTNADFLGLMAANPKPLIYTPGDKGNYDNVNFLLLAVLIEKIAGVTYEEYISKHILRPAGMRHTKLVSMRSQYGDDNKANWANPYLFPHRYSDSLVLSRKVKYVHDYWSAYNFSGFGDYTTTLEDLLAYDKAYTANKLLSASMQQKAFTPVKLNNGNNNARNFGLGWEVGKDSAFGKIVLHSGNSTGLSCVMIRNITRNQVVILYDNIHSNNSESLGYTVMNILNGMKVPPPRKSLADLYARVLLKQGEAAARDAVYKLKTDTLHYLLSEDELNLLGYDFMGGVNNPNPFKFPEEKRYTEALATFKLNTELFPGSWNVYDSYGEMLLVAGRKDEAVAMYKKSIELNPANEGGKKILKDLQ